MLSLLAVIDLKCFVIARYDTELACVVEFEGGHVVRSFLSAGAESLCCKCCVSVLIWMKGLW